MAEGKRLSMRQTREILRLRFEAGLSTTSYPGLAGSRRAWS